ncbi:MAG: peptidoglycan D,D-transpeptidase FtsI family protein [Chloroflexia bacterium]
MVRYLLRLLALGLAFFLAYLGLGTPSPSAWSSYGECLRGACLDQAMKLPVRTCTPPSEVGWWLCLLGAAFFLLAAFWPKRPERGETPLGHNVRVFGAFLLTAAFLVGLQLLRLQFFRAPDIGRQVAYMDPRNCDDDLRDVRPLIVEQRTRRGRIYDRNGVLLADIAVTADGRVRRVYPRGDLGHIVGFYNPFYGNAGLEATYDDYLAGRVNRDAWTAFIEELTHRPHRGNDLYLTLDISLQEAAERAYTESISETLGIDCSQEECPAGSVVLLDARTGEILAMVSYPRFDPRPLLIDPEADWAEEQARLTAYWQGLISSTNAPLLDRATSGLYPPGSAFKTLTAAAALDSGWLTQESVISCTDRFTVTGHVIVNVETGLARRMKRQDLLEDFQWSCNTAFARIALFLGAEKFGEYGRRFGLTFGSDLGLWDDFTDLPAATSTLAGSRTFLDIPTGLADTGYGQGEVQVTPLYMAMLAATVANEGTMMRPYLVARAVDPAGRVLYEARPTPLRDPISRQTAQTMKRLMVAVVEQGYGWRARIPGVQVAGKTGTAEAPPGKPHAWFIAFAPADHPRFAVAVVVEHAGHGSQHAAPIARRVLEAALGK